MRLIVLILSVDFLLISAHVAFRLAGAPFAQSFDITIDGAPPELFQYAKFAAIAAILIGMSARRGTTRYLILAGLFVYLLLDDMLSVHEGLGRHLASEASFAPAFGLRAADFGELAVSAGVMAAMLPALIWAYRSGSASFRIVSRNVALLFSVLVMFGVGIDMAHSMVGGVRWVYGFFGLVEDGGEMIATTLILGYLILLDEFDPERRSLLTAQAGRSISPLLRPTWITAQSARSG